MTGIVRSRIDYAGLTFRIAMKTQFMPYEKYKDTDFMKKYKVSQELEKAI